MPRGCSAKKCSSLCKRRIISLRVTILRYTFPLCSKCIGYFLFDFITFSNSLVLYQVFCFGGFKYSHYVIILCRSFCTHTKGIPNVPVSPDCPWTSITLLGFSCFFYEELNPPQTASFLAHHGIFLLRVAHHRIYVWTPSDRMCPIGGCPIPHQATLNSLTVAKWTIPKYAFVYTASF